MAMVHGEAPRCVDPFACRRNRKLVSPPVEYKDMKKITKMGSKKRTSWKLVAERYVWASYAVCWENQSKTMTMAKTVSNWGGGEETEPRVWPGHPCFHSGPLLLGCNHSIFASLPLSLFLSLTWKFYTAIKYRERDELD